MRLAKLHLLPVLLVAVLALLLPGLAWANVAGQFRVAIGSEASFPDPTLTAQRNSYIILQPWETARAAELKAADPSLEVLAYQNLGSMAQGTSASGVSASGVNYAEANTAHPEWFLLNDHGERIAENGYSWLWMADIGNPGYQQQWTANVIKLLDSGPWDGVMMDDTNTTAMYDTNPAEIAKYPTDAAYQAAVRSMLAYAGPRIQADGKLAIPNIGSWSQYPEVAKEWLQYVSGGVDEMFAKWSTTPGVGYRDPAGWRTQIEEIQTAEQMGKRFLAITQSSAEDTQAIRYGWASVLLAADPHGHTAFTAAPNYTSEVWSSEYEVQIGEPTTNATEVAGGVWERRFTSGLVVVNPTTVSVPVSLGGVYSGSGLSDVGSATLAPDSALVLQRVAGAGESSQEAGAQGSGEAIGSGLSGAGESLGVSGAGSSSTGSSGASSPAPAGGTPGSGASSTGITGDTSGSKSSGAGTGSAGSNGSAGGSGSTATHTGAGRHDSRHVQARAARARAHAARARARAARARARASRARAARTARSEARSARAGAHPAWA